MNLNNIKGFILNVPSDYKIGGIIALPWERKHWYSISKINNRKKNYFEYLNLNFLFNI